MPRFLIKLNDKYLEWSTITDSPATYGMSREEFEDYYLAQNGRRSHVEFLERMKRVEECGVSAFTYKNVDDLIENNRAGPDETCLTKEEIIKEFCQDPKEGD